jgi:hypothetical protein
MNNKADRADDASGANTASYSLIDVQPITGSFGAEIFGALTAFPKNHMGPE